MQYTNSQRKTKHRLNHSWLISNPDKIIYHPFQKKFQLTFLTHRVCLSFRRKEAYHMALKRVVCKKFPLCLIVSTQTHTMREIERNIHLIGQVDLTCFCLLALVRACVCDSLLCHFVAK